MEIIERQIIRNEKNIPAIEQALLETYFSIYDQDFLQTDPGKLDIENNVFRRYNHSLRHVVPWLSRCTTLEGKTVLEIGCGTGSSTAALAHYVQQIEGYDIHNLAVQGARKRLEIMGLNNVNLHTVTEDSLIKSIKNNSSGQYDIILLFAVLEHQTIRERHDTIKCCWNLLADEGIMAVIDTPNLLHYFDLHTSQLPFLHQLPTRLYAQYASKSPRDAFAKSFSEEKLKSEEQLELQISRWGRGASYHDFEVALGKNYKHFLLAEGFEPEILEWFPCTVEEEMLRWYVLYKTFDIPLGFTRCVLNLIFQKNLNKKREHPTADFAPPPYSIFQPDLMKRIEILEQELEEKNNNLLAIYDSATWKTGNLFATPYRYLKELFKVNT